MSRHVGSDLILPLFPWRNIGGQRQPSGRSAHRSCFGKRESSIQHICPNHRRRFHWIRFPTVGWSMQRYRIVSFRSWSRRVTPKYSAETAHLQKPLVSSSRLPRASSTQKRTTKWWWLQRCRSSSLPSNLCCVASRHTPWVWKNTRCFAYVWY